MRTTPLEHKLHALIAPAVESKGLDLVCVRLSGENGAHTLQIMAEDPTTRRLGVEDCSKLSREISALLDVADPIPGAYRLEIGSPGIDRLLTRARDFADYAGHEAKVEIERPMDGQRRFRGILRGLADGNDSVRLETQEKGEITLPLGAIVKAKLVLTDALIAATGAKEA